MARYGLDGMVFFITKIKTKNETENLLRKMHWSKHVKFFVIWIQNDEFNNQQHQYQYIIRSKIMKTTRFIQCGIKKNGNIELDKQHSNKTFKHKSIFFKASLIHRLEYFCCQSTRSSWRYRSLVCYF